MNKPEKKKIPPKPYYLTKEWILAIENAGYNEALDNRDKSLPSVEEMKDILFATQVKLGFSTGYSLPQAISVCKAIHKRIHE